MMIIRLATCNAAISINGRGINIATIAPMPAEQHLLQLDVPTGSKPNTQQPRIHRVLTA
jgi:hypothetical protein